jgi:hypothetical protein
MAQSYLLQTSGRCDGNTGGRYARAHLPKSHHIHVQTQRRQAVKTLQLVATVHGVLMHSHGGHILNPMVTQLALDGAGLPVPW